MDIAPHITEQCMHKKLAMQRGYATDTERASVFLVVVVVVVLKSSSSTSLGAASCSGLPRLTHDLQGPHSGPEGALLGFEMGRPFLMPSSQFFGPCIATSSSFSCEGGAGRNGAAGDLSRGVTGGSSVTAKAAASGSTCSLSGLSAAEPASSPESLSDWAAGASSATSPVSTVASSSSGTAGDAKEGAPSTRGERAVARIARGGEPRSGIANMALSVRCFGFGLERPADTPSATALAWAAGDSELLEEGVEAEAEEAEVSGCAASASACGCTVGGTNSSSGWDELLLTSSASSCCSSSRRRASSFTF